MIPEKFSKIFSQLIYVPSNRKSQKMLIFFNLMCLAHDISRKKTKKRYSVVFRDQEKGVYKFSQLFMIVPSIMISQTISAGFLSYEYDIALDHCDLRVPSLGKTKHNKEHSLPKFLDNSAETFV